AAALAAVLAEDEAQNNVLHLVLPSDHLITDEAAFHAAVANAAPAAREGRMVLFGITPDRPETGYGYILPGKPVTGAVCKVERFHEKPDVKNAQALIAKGALWNSGMFLYDPRTLLTQAKSLAPDTLAHCISAREHAKQDAKCTVLCKEAYAAMESH